MAFADNLELLTKLSPKVKFGIAAGLSVALWFCFYWFLYQDVASKVDSLDSQYVRLQEERSSFEDKKQKYLAFRAEVTKLLEEQKELVKVLPSAAEIPSFLQSIHAQAELAGLTINTFQQMREQKVGFYARIPVAMSITGSYHQITRFFYAVGNLQRIVNISGVKLNGARETPTGVILKASFVASTFRFLAAPTKKG